MYMDDPLELDRHKFLQKMRRGADGHQWSCVLVAGIPTHRHVLLYT
jgi:hypothetical protein